MEMREVPILELDFDGDPELEPSKLMEFLRELDATGMPEVGRVRRTLRSIGFGRRDLVTFLFYIMLGLTGGLVLWTLLPPVH